MKGKNTIKNCNRVAIVANKIDLLPSDVKESRVEQWLRQQLNASACFGAAHAHARARKLFLEKLDAVFLVSAKRGRNMPALRRWLRGAAAAATGAKHDFIVCGQVNR